MQLNVYLREKKHQTVSFLFKILHRLISNIMRLSFVKIDIPQLSLKLAK